MSKFKIMKIALASLLVVGLLAVGCPTPEPVERLTIAQGTDALTMDPHFIVDSPTASVLEHMYETLVELTVDGELVPGLATGWEVTEGATVFTLTIREGVQFHDGEPLNAAAVKANLDRRLDSEAGTEMMFLVAQIAEVNVLGDYTVEIKTTEPFAPMLNHLSHSNNAMVSPAALNVSWDEPVTTPVGTGPFEFKSRVPGDRLTMVRNDDYWGTAPQLEEIVWRVIPDDASRVIALETGEVDVIVRVPPLDIPRLEADADIDVEIAPSVRTIFLGFNVREAPLNNQDVRQALNYAVDKEAIVENILGGVGRVSDAPISPGIFGYDSIMTYGYNATLAEEMLDDAGYPRDGGGTRFAIELSPAVGRYYMDVEVAQAAAADLEAIGIDVTLNTMDWGTYITWILATPEEAEVYQLGWGCITVDADYGLFPMFHSEEVRPAGFNLGAYNNTAVDAFLETGRTTADPALREAAYKDAMEIIMDEAPWLFLHSESQVVASATYVKGLLVHVTERLLAHNAWLDN
ncbi:MAG: glutathione ABC transporter substrate-binding protein [Dehalococcoidia bacterium]